jgi:hypothetical protein
MSIIVLFIPYLILVLLVATEKKNTNCNLHFRLKRRSPGFFLNLKFLVDFLEMLPFLWNVQLEVKLYALVTAIASPVEIEFFSLISDGNQVTRRL